jgi:hypothetical protein
VAIGSGAAAHKPFHSSRSSIELVSAGVLLWRLDVEMRRGAELPERSAVSRGPRRITLRAAALALALLLAGYAADLSVLVAQLANDRVAGLPAAF